MHRFPRPNVVLWPNQTPAIFSHPLPLTTLAVPQPDLPPFSIGLQEMLSPNILQCSTLNAFDWMVAYAALSLHTSESPFLLDNTRSPGQPGLSLLQLTTSSKSPKGWIKVAVLPTYAGKGVPGNFDTHT